MRHDSESQVVRRILAETEALDDSLSQPKLSKTISPRLFDELEPLVSRLHITLNHFIKLHVFNPQLSLSRFSAYHIEQKLNSLKESISELFHQREFASVNAQVEWYRNRFLHFHTIADHEQLLVDLSQKIVQVLETYYVDRIRNTHIAAALNEFVGWVEHIEMQGHHDVYSVILFAEKVAQDSALIDHRTEVVRDVCASIEERRFLQHASDTVEPSSEQTSLELSRVYSPYLLELYEVLLTDMEIIAISNQDYGAFEKYCREHSIDVYEEYHDALKNHFRKYVEVIAGDIPTTLHTVKTANVIVNAQLIHQRYVDVDASIEVVGENLAKDIRVLERAVVQQLKLFYPDLTREYAATLRKVKKFRGEIMKPAIEVYGKYLKDPNEFFRILPENLAKWIPILDSALACLEQDDDLYQKCQQLKNKIDEYAMR